MFGRDIQQYHTLWTHHRNGDITKEGFLFLPTLDSKAKYLLIFSLKTVIISQLFLCLLPALPLNSAGASYETMVLMQCQSKPLWSGTAPNKVLRRIWGWMNPKEIICPYKGLPQLLRKKFKEGSLFIQQWVF